MHMPRLASLAVALGLPSWTALLACCACQGPCTACLGLSTAFPGLQDANWTPVGRQLDAKWAPNWTPQRLPVSTYALRAPKQLPSPTEHLANSAFVAGWRHMQHYLSIYLSIYLYRYIYIYIYIDRYNILVLHMSPLGDKQTVGKVFCRTWQLFWRS